MPPELKATFQAADQAIQEFEKSGNISALDTAIITLEGILRSPSYKKETIAFQLEVLGKTEAVFLLRFQAKDQLADLEAAIQHARQAVALIPEDTFDKAGHLNNLGIALAKRYRHSGDLADLDAAIDFNQQALAITPEGYPDKAGHLNNLANRLSDRYARSGDLTDLEAAIDYGQQAIANVPIRSPNQAIYLNNLGNRLSDRYNRSGDQADLDAAIELGQQAIALTPIGSPYHAHYLNNLGDRLSDRYDRSGNIADLEAAVRYGRQAVAETTDEDSNRAPVLNNLGKSLSHRYGRFGDLADLEAAILYAHQALVLTPERSPVKAGYFSNLGNLLSGRYHRSGDLADLEAAIEFTQKAVSLTSDDNPYRAPMLISLSDRLSDRYDHSSDHADLEAAIQFGQQAVALTIDKNPNRALMLRKLGYQLSRRYAHSGDLADLDAAIEFGQQAVALTTDENPDRAASLSNLSNQLSHRYAHSGSLADLDASVKYAHQAVAHTPRGSPDCAIYLTNLGNRLSDRYDRSDDPTDLEAAIEYGQQAVALTTDENPNKATMGINLGNQLSKRYLHSGDLADIDAAIQYCQQSISLTTNENPNRATVLNALSNHRSERYDRSGDVADLEAAFHYAKQAVDLSPERSPVKAGYLNNLGTVLSKRYSLSGDLADLEAGRSIFESTIAFSSTVNPEIVIKLSRNWGNWAMERGNWKEAVQAFLPGLDTINSLVMQHVLRTNKEAWLNEAKDIPASYAYALARTKQMEQALIAIETGQARLFSEQLFLTSIDLIALRMSAPALASEYENLLRQYQKEQSTELEVSEGIEQVGTRLNLINKQLTQLAGQIRAIDGFEDFLAPITSANIHPAAKNYPFAYLSTTLAGGMALLVLPGEKIEVLWFDELTQAQLLEKMAGPKGGPELLGYLGSYQDWTSSLSNEISQGVKKQAFQYWLSSVDSITGWLWENMMGQLVTWLVNQGYSQCALIPTGLFTLLPLHAAWTEDGTTPTNRRYALDQVFFSYVPNAQALLRAQENSRRRVESILVIENPNSDIPFSQQVSRAALEHFNESNSLLMRGNKASRINVLKSMPDSHVLHFWTHGLSIPNKPLDSLLLMAQAEPLTLKDILQLGLPHARLAVLAACETGIVGIRNINEVVSLPTGFLQAGVPGVIGSLWTVTAISTMMLLSKFYELWRGEQHRSPSQALTEAQIWLRDSTNREKEQYFQDLIDHNEQVEKGRSVKIPFRDLQNYLDEMLIKNADERSYSHPFYWAAFGFFGS